LLTKHKPRALPSCRRKRRSGVEKTLSLTAGNAAAENADALLRRKRCCSGRKNAAAEKRWCRKRCCSAAQETLLLWQKNADAENAAALLLAEKTQVQKMLILTASSR
jgi:hypothetical protein